MTRSIEFSFNLFKFGGDCGVGGKGDGAGKLRISEVKLMWWWWWVGGIRGLPEQFDLDSVAFSCF